MSISRHDVFAMLNQWCKLRPDSWLWMNFHTSIPDDMLAIPDHKTEEDRTNLESWEDRIRIPVCKFAQLEIQSQICRKSARNNRDIARIWLFLNVPQEII